MCTFARHGIHLKSMSIYKKTDMTAICVRANVSYPDATTGTQLHNKVLGTQQASEPLLSQMTSALYYCYRNTCNEFNLN